MGRGRKGPSLMNPGLGREEVGKRQEQSRGWQGQDLTNLTRRIFTLYSEVSCRLAFLPSILSLIPQSTAESRLGHRNSLSLVSRTTNENAQREQNSSWPPPAFRNRGPVPPQPGSEAQGTCLMNFVAFLLPKVSWALGLTLYVLALCSCTFLSAASVFPLSLIIPISIRTSVLTNLSLAPHPPLVTIQTLLL